MFEVTITHIFLLLVLCDENHSDRYKFLTYSAFCVLQKMKGLMRKRSSTAARLQRALSAKSLRPESPPPPPRSIAPADKRTFIMEAPVQFTAVSSVFAFTVLNSTRLQVGDA